MNGKRTNRRAGVLAGSVVLSLGLTAPRGSTIPAAQVGPADTARVGNGVVDASALQPYQAEFKLTRIAADGTESSAGWWTDDLRTVDAAGRALLRREVARYDSSGVNDLWRVHLADRTTLEPVLLHQKAGPRLDQIMHVDFQGRNIIATVLPGPEAAAVRQEYEVGEIPFDASLFAVLLASFPLADGFASVYPVLSPGGTIVWDRMQVIRREAVDTPSGPVEAWVVEAASRPWTAWLGAEPPYIARIEQRQPDGSRWVSEQVARHVPR